MRAARAKNLRYKRGALASMGYESMVCELEEILEECEEVSWYSDDMDTLIAAFDGDDEEAYEFRFAFSDLSAKAETLYGRMGELEDAQDYDDCTIGIIGNRYQLIGYDAIEEDYFSLTNFESQLAVTEAGKRLMRHTKAEMLSMIGQAVGILVAFLDLRQQYDYLKAAIDVLTNDNRSILKQVREIEKLYEKVAVRYPEQQDLELFDKILERLPERMWIE